jgi:hypothetical protein
MDREFATKMYKDAQRNRKRGDCGDRRFLVEVGEEL